MSLATGAAFQGVAGREVSRAQKPAGQGELAAGERSGFFLKNDENGLRHVLGQMGIAHLTASGGIDQLDMTIDDLRKSVVRSGAGVFIEPLKVLHRDSVVRKEMDARSCGVTGDFGGLLSLGI